MNKIYKFKKGEVVQLDYVYKIFGIIPNDAFTQDDIGDFTITNDNDSGETLKFIKNVTIKISVKVT